MAEISLRKLPPGENTPLYAQIMGILEQEIRSGRLKPGDQLPTQEALAQHFEVSLAPVKQALRELEERGVIATRQGRGTYILDATPLSEEIIDANRIPNFTRDMAEMGREPSSRVLSIRETSPRDEPQAASELKLHARERLVRIERVRLADGKPLCVQTCFFPRSRVEGIVERGLIDGESLTSVLQGEYGITIAVARQTISATAATDRDARELQITPGAPMLLVERTSFLSTSEPVEFLVDRRVPDFSFMVWLRRK